MIIYKAEELNKIFDLNDDYIKLLSLLEKINPCNQFYEITKDSLIISYDLKLNLFNFKNILPLNVKAHIIGLPISLSQRGYFGDLNKVLDIIKKRKGLKIILNADTEIIKGSRTLSTFEFTNNFNTFDDYLNKLRSSYRRRLIKALSQRNNIIIRKITNSNFTPEHYNLYISIMNRADNPLEILPIEFFRQYETEIFEFIDKRNENIIGFIQIKEFYDKLCFLFGGFNKEDVKKFDIYYNMLLKIIEIGIEKKVKKIDFGQTAEESKLKIGCKEVNKYLYAHHSNTIINSLIQKLLPLMSYRPYKIVHHVLKE
ncbi:MAG: peptidogalycan biosysnthesis protein [Patescibacteria group bacterium]|nr:peptidogalycan biosysnthesis protein [Patescibacteria group bacterium]